MKGHSEMLSHSVKLPECSGKEDPLSCHRGVDELQDCTTLSPRAGVCVLRASYLGVGTKRVLTLARGKAGLVLMVKSGHVRP